jgi:hypothetical protein
MLAGSGLGVAGMLTVEQFLENCAEGPEGDPAEAAHYRRHPRLCPAAADDLLATAFAIARASGLSEDRQSAPRAIGIAAWCVVNHPRDGGVIRRKISDVLRTEDRVAITVVTTHGAVAVDVGIVHAPPFLTRASRRSAPS